MLDIPTRGTQDRIEMIVRGFLKNPPDSLSPDQDLEGLGLTSVDMVNLMLSIEAEFDLTIPGAKLVPANFRSVAKIDGLVRELTG